MEIGIPTPDKPTTDRLKNYNNAGINLDTINGMHCYTYDPNEASNESDDNKRIKNAF